jgi:phosphate:Na+ symporter
LGVLAGMLVTTVVQSSSASVAILQTLAMQGIVDYRTSMFVLFGQNIGTCVTALLASLGTNKNAKRAAVIHLLFNLIGTVIFVMLIWVSMSAGMPFFSDFIESLTDNPSVRIALTHLVFNVTTTVMLFPFGNLLVKLSGKIVPGQDKDSGEMKLKYLDDNTLKTPMIAAAQVLREVIRMADTVKANLETSLRALGTHNQELAREVYAREKLINFLNHAITAYLVKINTLDLEPRDVRMVSALYHVINDLERIGDHAENIADDVIHCLTYRFELMPDQLEEINRMGKDATEMFDLALDMFGRQKYEQSKADEIEVKEKQVDETKLRLRRRNIEGLTAGEYSAEQGVVFVRVVSNLERVADHATNIAYSLNEHDHPLDPYTKASI